MRSATVCFHGHFWVVSAFSLHFNAVLHDSNVDNNHSTGQESPQNAIGKDDDKHSVPLSGALTRRKQLCI